MLNFPHYCPKIQLNTTATNVCIRCYKQQCCSVFETDFTVPLFRTFVLCTDHPAGIAGPVCDWLFTHKKQTKSLFLIYISLFYIWNN